MQVVDIQISPTLEAPVIVIGSAGMDIVGRLEGDSQLGTSNPGLIRRSFGGVARNVAENLARLGLPVTLISAVGNDSAGDDLLDQVSQAGVDVNRVLRTDEYPTGTYLGIINAAGELQFGIDDIRATRLLTTEYVREHTDQFKNASKLFFDANLEKKTIKTIMSLARKAGLWE